MVDRSEMPARDVEVEQEEEVQAPADPKPLKKGRKRASTTTNTIPEEEVNVALGVVKTGKGKRRKSIISQQPMTTARKLPLLVCSLGNPGTTYANTFHSAGHTVLNRLASHLQYPQFQKDRDHGKGLISNDGDWTLWQSTDYMNESGKGVKAAYATWSRQIPDEGRLVIVHDELEKPLGAVSVRTAQGASAKGHNGLKSVMARMPGTPFARIGVGIGRPVSRESNEVARYVLRKMTPAEREKIEGCVEEVVRKLVQLEKG